MSEIQIYSIKGTNETKRYTVLALDTFNSDNFIKNLALIQRIITNGKTFIIASNAVIDNENMEIEWDFGNYYSDIVTAVDAYVRKYKEITHTEDVPFNPPYNKI